MKLFRNSPAHIAAFAKIDTEFGPKLNALRLDFLDHNPGLDADELAEHPEWMAVSSRVRQQWDEALTALRELVVDSVHEL